MNRFASRTKLALAVVVALGISACNDTGETVPSTPFSKTTSGIITGFGSVFVNGVEYETDGTNFIVDGVAGDESLLKLGMVVTLKGTDDTDGTGDAVEIEFEDEVEGLVLTNNILSDGTLNVMGLIVRTNEDTIFESNIPDIVSLDGLVKNNIIEVSGFSAGDGTVWATRIEVKKAYHEDNEEIQVKGLIASLTDTTFMIGDLLVDYSAAELDDDLGNDGLMEGMRVKVESKMGLNESNVLIASEIELKSRNGKREHKYNDGDDKVELEGLVTALVSEGEIEINGAPVLLDVNTFFVHGDLQTLNVGFRVKVVGNINSEGSLVAEKLVYKPTGDLKLVGQISAPDNSTNTFSLLGKTVAIDNYTMVKDSKDDDDHLPVIYNFGVDDLVAGDWVEVKAYANANGDLTAIKMKRKDFKEDRKSKLVGAIDSIDLENSQLVVAGITIDYASLASFDFVVGDKVEIEGSFVEGVFIATELELEEDDNEYYISGAEGHEDDERGDRDRDGRDEDNSDESLDDNDTNSSDNIDDTLDTSLT